MGKSGKERKRRKLAAAAAATISTRIDDVDDRDPSVGAAEVAIATRVIETMAKSPDLFRGQKYKLLRGALHTLRQSEAAVAVFGFGSKDMSHTLKVSEALREERWQDAHQALAEMRHCKKMPKLGAVCRWVRDLDAVMVDRTADYDDTSIDDTNMRDPCYIWPLLDSVLRTCSPAQVGAMRATQELQSLQGSMKHRDTLSILPPWEPLPDRPREYLVCGETLTAAQNQPEDQKARIRQQFRSCLEEEGPNRKPPNEHPLTIHTSQPMAIPIDPQMDGKQRVVPIPFIAQQSHPQAGVHAFLLENLLSDQECKDIVEAGEALGYDPDRPLNSLKSVLAHAFVWLVDQSFSDALWKRIAPHVPADINGCHPVGLNRRWRCYRYVPGAVYRPHIDGAWPGSGLDPDGNYVYDDYADGTWSRLTFLIYLNDDFRGGYTTFFEPSKQEKLIEARGVLPRKGCALVFPHGDAAAPVLHEGSGVTEGAKYVIRTDVLYK